MTITGRTTRGNRRGNTRRLNIVTTGGSPVISIGRDATLDKGEPVAGASVILTYWAAEVARRLTG